LVNYFAGKQAELNNLGRIEISAEAVSFLQSLPYPGNIRELKNLVDRTILISGKSLITDKDFKEQYTDTSTTKSNLHGAVYPLDELERNMIIKAMDLYGNNISKVSIALGLTRQALYRRLEKYGISFNPE